jgi:hypothetical protein
MVRYRVMSLFVILSISCSTNSPVNIDMKLDYFPMNVGRFYIYQVEETDIVNNAETKSIYELRVVVTDSTINENGVVSYILHRSKLNSGNGAWTPVGTWSVKIEVNKVIQNEDNTLFVKLVFPPSPNLAWNGNEYNHLSDNGNLFNDRNSGLYRIADLDKPASLGTGFEASQTLTVIQNSFNDPIIGRDERKEIYARNAGLIYKEVIQWKYCTSASCAGQQRVEKGMTYIQTLKDHGKI